MVDRAACRATVDRIAHRAAGMRRALVEVVTRVHRAVDTRVAAAILAAAVGTRVVVAAMVVAIAKLKSQSAVTELLSS
jgi:hypothetical protein